MPVSIPGWKTSDDKFHTSYMAALKHELMLWLAKAGDNEVCAKKIVEALDASGTKMLIESLTEIAGQLETPTEFTVIKASKSPE